MVYSVSITTPKNTLERSPKLTKLKVAKGVIVQWDIVFPFGSKGTLSLFITRGSRWVLPLSLGSAIVGDNNHFSFPEFHVLDDEPFELDFYTWNTSSENDHKLDVHVVIQPPQVLYPFSEYLYRLSEQDEKSPL